MLQVFLCGRPLNTGAERAAKSNILWVAGWTACACSPTMSCTDAQVVHIVLIGEFSLVEEINGKSAFSASAFAYALTLCVYVGCYISVQA